MLAMSFMFLIALFSREGENEVWYYSTKKQLEELFRTLDCTYWERDLMIAFEDLKEDLYKQMAITDDLTNQARGNKKSVLEIENGT